MGAAQSGLFYAGAPLSPRRVSSTSSRGMGILPMRNNPARPGQDAHATEYFRRSIFLCPPFSMQSLSLFLQDHFDCFFCSSSEFLLHEKSNFESLPGRAGGSPIGL